MKIGRRKDTDSETWKFAKKKFKNLRDDSLVVIKNNSVYFEGQKIEFDNFWLRPAWFEIIQE